MEERLQIRIGPNGRIEAETLGIRGAKCQDVIELLEQLLNAEVSETTLKPEYYEVEVDELKIRETLKKREG